MADSLARLQLARAARSFSRRAGCAAPTLVLLMDDDRLPDPAPALDALPRASLVIVRSRTQSRRNALADIVRRAARRRGHMWLVADDPRLAGCAGAHGAHFPERAIAQARCWRVRRPKWFITCSAHSPEACLRAQVAGADAVLLSPVFATASHPQRLPMGSLRMRLFARNMPIPLYALGGIDSCSARRLRGAPLAGLAAIAGLDPD